MKRPGLDNSFLITEVREVVLDGGVLAEEVTLYAIGVAGDMMGPTTVVELLRADRS